MDLTQTFEVTTPFHTQGISNKTQARTHYLGGRQIATYKGTRFDGTTTHQVGEVLLSAGSVVDDQPALPASLAVQSRDCAVLNRLIHQCDYLCAIGYVHKETIARKITVPDASFKAKPTL